MRKKCINLVALLAALGVLITAVSPQVGASKNTSRIPADRWLTPLWSHYQGDASAKGYFPASIGNNPSPTWETAQGHNKNGNGVAVKQIIIDPSAAKYLLIMPDEISISDSECPDHNYGKLRAYNYLTGQLVWSKGSCTDYVGGFTGRVSLAAGFGRVFVTDKGFSSVDNAQLHAVNPSTGEVFWTRNDLGHDIETSPIIGEDYVYIGANGTVYALNPLTGETVWRRPFFNTTLEREMALIAEELYVLAYQTNYGLRLYKLDTITGTVEWGTTSLSTDSRLSFPTITPFGVVVGSGNTFFAYSRCGSLLWKHSVSGYVNGGSALTSANLKSIIVTWSHYPAPFEVRASVLNLESGEPIRTFPIETYIYNNAAPIVSGNTVLFNTHYGHLKMFSVNTGDLIWDSGVYDGGGGWITPILAANRVTVIGINGIIKQWNVYVSPFSTLI